MRVEQHRMAVPQDRGIEQPAQRVVVGLPVAHAPPQDVVRSRTPVDVQVHPVERLCRAEPGGHLAGIERGIVGWPVQVDDVARQAGLQPGCAGRLRERIQAIDVPVGVGHPARRGRHASRNLGRDLPADVRQADHERRRARPGVDHGASIGRLSPCSRAQSIAIW